MFLALAFMLVGIATYFLGRRNGAARTVRLPRDYLEGLDHLINDRFDHATEIFARMAQADGDAAEIQFALGFFAAAARSTGRSPSIHGCADHGVGSVRPRGLELALDYQSAGLMDRAERVFEERAASPA
jgi:lipopolysaccharide biosynthesis regulator YciM